MSIEKIIFIYTVVATLFLVISVLAQVCSGEDTKIKHFVWSLFFAVVWPITTIVLLGTFLEFVSSLSFWDKTIIKGKKQPEEKENLNDGLMYEED